MAYYGARLLGRYISYPLLRSRFFLQRFIKHLEQDPDRQDRAWACVYCAGLFASNVIMYRECGIVGIFLLHLTLRLLLVISGQLWSISTTDVNVRFRTQLNTLLFGKTRPQECCLHPVLG